MRTSYTAAGDRLLIKGRTVKRFLGVPAAEVKQLAELLQLGIWQCTIPEVQEQLAPVAYLLQQLPDWLLEHLRDQSRRYGYGQLPPQMPPKNPQPEPEAAEREEGESRKKGTDEVAPASDAPSADSTLHGGDGNSGEVDSEAQTSASEDRAKEMRERYAKRERKSGFTMKKPYSARNELRMQEYRVKYRGNPMPYSPVPAENAPELHRSLQRLFKGWGRDAGDDTGGLAESPRLDGVKIVREMVSKRWDLSRTFRQELEYKPSIYLLMADVSGSCSAASGATTGICKAVADLYPGACMWLTHANGKPSGIYFNGVARSAREEETLLDIVKEYRIRGIVHLGDADGLRELRAVWTYANAPMIWCDSYCAKAGVVAEEKVWKQFNFQDWDLSPEVTDADKRVRYFYGVNNDKAAAKAIRMALR